MWWRTRDSLSQVSQWFDFLQNQGVPRISLLFKILMVHEMSNKGYHKDLEKQGDLRDCFVLLTVTSL